MVQDGYAAFLRRWLWLLALGIIIGIGAGLLFRAAQPLNTLEARWPPQLYHPVKFQSTATLRMLPNSELIASGLVSQEDLNILGQSLASEVKTPSVLEAVSADMSFSVNELAAMIEAIPLAGSTGVEITASSYDPVQPGLIAEKVAYHLSQQVANDQEAKLTSRISQIARSIEALKAEMAAADTEGQQDSGGNVSGTVDVETAALRQMYSDLYREYISLSLGLGGGTVEGNVTRNQEINELTQSLEALKAEIDKADAAQQQASGGVVASAANIETAVRRQLYTDLYSQYVNLSIQLPVTADQLFMPTEITPVHEVSPNRISSRNVVVLGGLGGLALAWSLAGGIDYVRRKRRAEEEA
jgi:hypothetical protein